MAVGIRCAYHVTTLYPQKLALTSPTGGGRSVGIVRSWTKATEFIYVLVFGCKLCLFRLCGSGFGITPVDDITIGIIWAAFRFHIARISFASSWYLFRFSVIVLAKLCVFGTAMSIRKVSLFSYS